MNPFEDMRIFCQVMDSGSFTAAADQLGLSKQFVSRRLMQLEERLGVRLLNRSTRRLDVTPLGQSYYESALRLLSEVEQVEQGIAGQTTEPRGTLRVSAPLSFALAHLGCLLPAFLQRYREVTVEVDLSDRPVDLLGEGYDLALRIGILEDSTLIARRIASIQRVYCASPAYLSERGTPLKPEDLHNHDCLPYGHGRQVQWRFAGQGKPLAVNVTGRMRVNNGELLKDAAIAHKKILMRLLHTPAHRMTMASRCMSPHLKQRYCRIRCGDIQSARHRHWMSWCMKKPMIFFYVSLHKPPLHYVVIHIASATTSEVSSVDAELADANRWSF